MKCEQLREQVPDYLMGNLDETTTAEIESHLAICTLCKEEAGSLGGLWKKLGLIPEEQPSSALRPQFYATLEAYMRGMTEAAAPQKQERFVDWLRHQWANQPAFQFVFAMMFLFVGLAVGHFLPKKEGRDGEIVQLREEVHNMSQLVTLSLLQQQSASERLRGVNWSYRVEQPDREVLSALLETLNSDPNVNVRLAAVDALRQSSSSSMVKQGLIQALTRKNSPLVQISLIDLMVEMQERQSIEIFRQLARDEKLNQAVRQRAEWGLKQLS